MLRFIAGRLIVVLSVGLTLSIVTFFLLNYVSVSTNCQFGLFDLMSLENTQVS